MHQRPRKAFQTRSSGFHSPSHTHRHTDPLPDTKIENILDFSSFIIVNILRGCSEVGADSPFVTFVSLGKFLVHRHQFNIGVLIDVLPGIGITLFIPDHFWAACQSGQIPAGPSNRNPHHSIDGNHLLVMLGGWEKDYLGRIPIFEKGSTSCRSHVLVGVSVWCVCCGWSCLSEKK